MKTMLFVMLMIIGLSGAAFATNQNHSQSKQEPIRLAAVHQCYKDSDCGDYHKCCFKSSGNRCISKQTVGCPS